MRREANSALSCLLAVLVSGLLASSASAQIQIDWVEIGDPGNACDPQPNGCFGSVDQVYEIGRFEVTNAEYAAFLNAVAASDPNELYHPSMSILPQSGIDRAGSAGTFTYSLIAGREDWPVNMVSFYDALRFVNWLHNGQPTGAQNDATTEDGAYQITAQGIADNSIVRRATARFFIPSEDEWYKAAYYDPGSVVYYDYPAGTDLQTVCSGPTASFNRANCSTVSINNAFDVGSYPNSFSPYATADQGGNHSEWTETIFGVDERGRRGGSFQSPGVDLGAPSFGQFGSPPAGHATAGGFRVAMAVLPPSVPAIGPLGWAALWIFVATLTIRGGRHRARRR